MADAEAPGGAHHGVHFNWFEIVSTLLLAVAAVATARGPGVDRHAYVLCVVLLAMALFFAGISARLRPGLSRLVVLGLGWAIFLGTIVWVATFPVTVKL